MQRRRIIGLVGLVALAAIVTLVIVTTDREPRYQGRALSEWLEQLDRGVVRHAIRRAPGGVEFATSQGQQPAEAQAAADALKAIGTNALPFVIKWMRYRPSTLTLRARTIVAKLPRRLTYSRLVSLLMLTKNDRRAVVAVDCVAILGPRAAAAVPALVSVINSPYNIGATMHAITALSCVGPDGLMPLLTCVTNRALPGIARSKAWGMLEWVSPFDTNAIPAIPILISFLKDRQSQVSLAAATALGNLTLSPETVVPALVEALGDKRGDVRRAAVVALAKFGPDAGDALPALMKACQDPDPVVSRTAKAAVIAVQQGTGPGKVESRK